MNNQILTAVIIRYKTDLSEKQFVVKWRFTKKYSLKQLDFLRLIRYDHMIGSADFWGEIILSDHWNRWNLLPFHQIRFINYLLRLCRRNFTQIKSNILYSRNITCKLSLQAVPERVLVWGEQPRNNIIFQLL